MMKNLPVVYKSVFVLIALLSVLSCSSMQNLSKGSSKSLDNFPKNWLIHGRMSITNDKENWYAKFIWEQKDTDFKISFMGPLGEIELLLSKKNQTTLLKTSSYERMTNNLEQLLLEETGWTLPISSLRFWSYGVANPDYDAQFNYDKLDNISELEQLGWHVQYPKRMQVGEYSLPKKIIVTQKDHKIKIIISQWHFQIPDSTL